jgi:hypothetical protein
VTKDGLQDFVDTIERSAGRSFRTRLRSIFSIATPIIERKRDEGVEEVESVLRAMRRAQMGHEEEGEDGNEHTRE